MRETATPSCSCATSPPRFTESSRSRPRSSAHCPGPRGSTWAKRVPRVGGALARTRASPGARARRSAHSSPIRPVWTCSRSSPSTFRADRRLWSRAGRSRRCHLLAGGLAGKSTRSAWRIFGWTSRRPRCCWKQLVSSSMRASCPTLPRVRKAGLPACTSQRCPCRRGRQGRLATRASTGVTASCPSTFASSSSHDCRWPRRRFSSTRPSWTACPAGFATPCSRRRSRHEHLTHSSAPTASWCA